MSVKQEKGRNKPGKNMQLSPLHMLRLFTVGKRGLRCVV